MPKAEVGSAKYLSNQMKRKGLQRLRWYCQVCEKQCPDANGFKMHTQSESHVRQMLLVGEDPKRYINDFSNQFQRDFLQLLKTGHGEKQVHINHFYQEYIANKEHIHMNATKWPSLTEFAKHLGREGICRVEENEKGIHVSWIDNSPEALRRQDALRRKEAQDQGDADAEERMLREQIRRAQAQAASDKAAHVPEIKDADRELKLGDGERLTLKFGVKSSNKDKDEDVHKVSSVASELLDETAQAPPATGETQVEPPRSEPIDPPRFGGVSMKMGGKPQTKNVFARPKKDVLSGTIPKGTSFGQPKKMSEAERIMKAEMARKRPMEKEGNSMPVMKRHKPA